MLAKLKATLSKRAPSGLDELLEAFSREVLPILAAVRDAINEAIGDETRYSLLEVDRAPAFTSSNYADVDTVGTTIQGAAFNIDDFAEESLGRARRVYFRVVGCSTSSTRTISWQLYDVTSGAAVADSEFSTSETTPEDSGLIGPLTLGSGKRQYRAQAKRSGVGASCVTLTAEVVIRYE